jgi:hypothetical protein
MSNIESVKDTIRKLLNLAKNNAATEGEVNNATKFAVSLMAKYHIEESELAESSVMQEMIQAGAWGNGRKLVTWELCLATFVKDFIGSVICYVNKSVVPKKNEFGLASFDDKGEVVYGQTIQFFGIAEEVQLAKSLYEDLALTIATMARLKYGTALRKEGKEYGDGFVSGLFQQMRLAKQEQLQLTQKCTALVVQKKALVDAEFKKQGVRLGKATQSKVRVTGVYHDGVSDGRKMDVSANRTAKLGNQTRQIGYDRS